MTLIFSCLSRPYHQKRKPDHSGRARNCAEQALASGDLVGLNLGRGTDSRWGGRPAGGGDHAFRGDADQYWSPFGSFATRSGPITGSRSGMLATSP